MANTLLTINMITNEALRILRNKLSFTAGVNREYDGQFAQSGAKIGDTLNIRKPARYVGRTGPALSVEAFTETSVPLALTTQFGVDLSFTTKELTLSLDDFSNRVLAPAIATIANKVDYDGMQQALRIGNGVGTPGTRASLLSTYLAAGAVLDDEGCPRDDERSVVIDPWTQAGIVDSLKGLFQDSTSISSQYRKGLMGTAAGFDWAMDQNCPSRVVGNAALIAVGAAGQSGSSIAITGAMTGTLNAGDLVTIEGVYSVNPQSRQSTGNLRTFTAAAASTGGTIVLSPALVTTGPLQNVTGSPAAAAVVTVIGTAGATSRVGLAYHRDAFTLGCADLVLPRGVDMASRASDKETGLSIRAIRAYDINSDAMPLRLDILYGWATLYQELACRIESGTTVA